MDQDLYTGEPPNTYHRKKPPSKKSYVRDFIKQIHRQIQEMRYDIQEVKEGYKGMERALQVYTPTVVYSATTPSATTPSATTPSATTPSATTPSATTPSSTTGINTPTTPSATTGINTEMAKTTPTAATPSTTTEIITEMAKTTTGITDPWMDVLTVIVYSLFFLLLLSLTVMAVIKAYVLFRYMAPHLSPYLNPSWVIYLSAFLLVGVVNTCLSVL